MMPELHDSPVYPGCFSLWGEREPSDALPPDDFDDEDEEDW